MVVFEYSPVLSVFFFCVKTIGINSGKCMNMASSYNQIDKPQCGRHKRAELLDVNINMGSQTINSEGTSSTESYRSFYFNFSNSLIIQEAKTKDNHKRDGFGNVIKHLHKLAKVSPSFSPEVCICLRSCIRHLH